MILQNLQYIFYAEHFRTTTFEICTPDGNYTFNFI